MKTGMIAGGFVMILGLGTAGVVGAEDVKIGEIGPSTPKCQMPVSRKAKATVVQASAAGPEKPEKAAAGDAGAQTGK